MDRCVLSRHEIRDVISKLITWIGDDPNRDGLRSTPENVLKLLERFFIGYSELDFDTLTLLDVKDCGCSSGLVVMKGIDFISYCEHHFVQIKGVVHIGYVPHSNIAGLGSLVRIVRHVTSRLQLQERITHQIGELLDVWLKPCGIAVMIEAQHECISSHGCSVKGGESLITSYFSGVLLSNNVVKHEFMGQVGKL